MGPDWTRQAGVNTAERSHGHEHLQRSDPRMTSFVGTHFPVSAMSRCTRSLETGQLQRPISLTVRCHAVRSPWKQASCKDLFPCQCDVTLCQSPRKLASGRNPFPCQCDVTLYEVIGNWPVVGTHFPVSAMSRCVEVLGNWPVVGTHFPVSAMSRCVEVLSVRCHDVSQSSETCQLLRTAGTLALESRG